MVLRSDRWSYCMWGHWSQDGMVWSILVDPFCFPSRLLLTINWKPWNAWLMFQNRWGLQGLVPFEAVTADGGGKGHCMMSTSLTQSAKLVGASPGSWFRQDAWRNGLCRHCFVTRGTVPNVVGYMYIYKRCTTASPFLHLFTAVFGWSLES